MKSIHPIQLHGTAIALLLAAASVSAQTTTRPAGQAAQPGEAVVPLITQDRSNWGTPRDTVVQEGGHASDAIGHLNRAIRVLHQMGRDRELAARLNQSKGVFIVPDSVRVAVGIGARGGAGVLLVRRPDGWGTPAFYNMAGVTIGPQLGAEGGALAFILNDQKALNGFAQENKFSLNAGAGLTVVDWSKRGVGSLGWGDITAWSDTEGLFGGAALAISDISFDGPETSAYYRKPVTPREVLAGRVANPHLAQLRAALADFDTATGAAGFGGKNDTGSRSEDADLRRTTP